MQPFADRMLMDWRSGCLPCICACLQCFGLMSTREADGGVKDERSEAKVQRQNSYIGDDVG